jgi:hypothetical protein
LTSHERVPIGVDPIEDFVTVVIDGAYVHFYEGFLSLLFFRDKEFPSHGKNGDVTKTRVKREILHEVRMAIPIAKTITKDLDEGLTAYAQLGFLLEDRNFWRTHKLTESSEIVNFDRPRDKMDDLVWASFRDMFDNCTKEGQDKIMDALTQFLHENIEDIRKISEDHPKDKEKVYKIKQSE